VTSAASGGRTQGIPRDATPQIALAGRSNVGKSSLINALCRRTVARTSAAPGKTRLANIYRVELEGVGRTGRRAVYFVDLPGYGYARGGGDSARELAAVAEAYFSDARSSAERRAPSASTTLLLVDSRHPGLDSDRQAFEWLARMRATPHVVATKIDKLSRSERTRNLRDLEQAFGTPPLPVSAATGEGLDALWKLVVRFGKDTDKTEEQR